MGSNPTLGRYFSAQVYLNLLETGCLRSILSSLGRNKHAPAPQGPGFPLHEPSVKPQTTSLSAERICSSMIVLASSSWALLLDLEDPRLFQYSGR